MTLLRPRWVKFRFVIQDHDTLEIPGGPFDRLERVCPGEPWAGNSVETARGSAMELFPPRQLKLVHGNTQMGLGNRGCGQRPGGSRRIGECGGLPQYFRCSGPTCAVLGSQARCASICLSEQAAVFAFFATTHAILCWVETAETSTHQTLLPWSN